MLADHPLAIFEIRARDRAAFDLFENADNLRRLGPNLEGLHWEADFAFIFFSREAGPEAESFLREHPQLDLKHIHHLTYGQWQDGAEAEPFEVEGLTVSGPHSGTRSVKVRRQVIIDPGLAFGFGGHPTTRTCLAFLGRLCAFPEGPPKTALDLGAGTGVLSLAAAHFGIERVTGVDYSHLAADAAMRNLRLNQLEDRVSFFRGAAQDYAGHPGELLMANLHLSLQEELLDLGAFQNRRLLIISGLLPSEGDRLFSRLEAAGFRLLDQVRTDRWITMLLKQG